MNTDYTRLSEQDLNCCEKFDLWCFHHSSLGIFREHGANTWCTCFDCCSSCLELQCNNECSRFLVELGSNSNDDCIVLCCCVSYTLL